MYFGIAEWAEEYVYGRLTPSANHVLRYLVAHALVGKHYWHKEEYGVIDSRWSQMEVVSRQTSLSESTVKRTMKELEDIGFIHRRRESQVTGKITAGNPYVIDIMPLIDGVFTSPDMS